MMGCYDFCAHYEWTFAWLERMGGQTLLREYWDASIHRDSQRHAHELIAKEGFEGMAKYWGHTLAEESPDAGYAVTRLPGVFRIDMHNCPSKGFLLRNGVRHHNDYCDHCIGWIGPLMKENGYVIDHEHNHAGQCWWEMRHAHDASHATLGATASGQDVRLRPEWMGPDTTIDRFNGATGPEFKTSDPEIALQALD